MFEDFKNAPFMVDCDGNDVKVGDVLVFDDFKEIEYSNLGEAVKDNPSIKAVLIDFFTRDYDDKITMIDFNVWPIDKDGKPIPESDESGKFKYWLGGDLKFLAYLGKKGKGLKLHPQKRTDYMKAVTKCKD